MSTAGDERKLREEIARLLRGTESELRTSGLGRLARTALSAARARRLLKLGDDVANLEALAKLVGSVGELKGTAMKVGQLLSYVEVPIPSQVKNALSVLQTQSPPCLSRASLRSSAATSGTRGLRSSPEWTAHRSPRPPSDRFIEPASPMDAWSQSKSAIRTSNEPSPPIFDRRPSADASPRSCTREHWSSR
jgi:hypothetical protein